jgi:hypothetical protein
MKNINPLNFFNIPFVQSIFVIYSSVQNQVKGRNNGFVKLESIVNTRLVFFPFISTGVHVMKMDL